MKKILVLCDYGEHRSVIMAKVLRERGHFAVAGSYDSFNMVDDEEVLVGYDDYGRIYLKFEQFFDEIIFMQEKGEHFIGRDTPEVSDYEWEQRCHDLANKFGL